MTDAERSADKRAKSCLGFLVLWGLAVLVAGLSISVIIWIVQALT